MSATVALTGATGFIGSALAWSLRTQGWRVRALVRPGADVSRLPADGVERVPGALDDADGLRLLVRGADAVVHCAGAVRGTGPAHFDAVNVAGVARLAAATLSEAPGAGLVLISSLAARCPELSWYAASKLGGERALAAAGGGLRWTVLRPPAVYGAGDRELRPLLRWMARGIAPVLGPPHARFSLLHVDDLTDATLHLLRGASHRHEVFEIHDGRGGGYAWADVVEAVQDLRGGRVVRVRVPATALRLAARLGLAAARLGARPPMLTPGKVREITHPDWICDNDPLTLATGWRPRVGIVEGLRRTLGGDGEARREHDTTVRERPGADLRGAGAVREG